MKRAREQAAQEPMVADPFGEHRQPRYRKTRQVLGLSLTVESDSAALMRIADDAFGGLFSSQGAHGETRAATLSLRLRSAGEPSRRARPLRPPPLTLCSGAGVLTASLGDIGAAIVAPNLGAALVVVAPQLLRSPYHIRYELLEFAACTLAARMLDLAPLHGACVGGHGHAALLLGDSGAGKSTLAAQCLLDGLTFIAEDSVFVQPRTLLAAGMPAYLHLRASSLRLLGAHAARLPLKEARTIRRRSGIAKLEIDLRLGSFRSSRRPPRIAALVFVSAARAADARVLVPIKQADAWRRLRDTQPYAAGQPVWPGFLRAMTSVPAYELRRGSHPRVASKAVQEILRCASR